MKSAFAFAQLLEDESAFWEFVKTTGDIWCRAVGDHPRQPKYEPLPVAEYFRRYPQRCEHYNSVDVYLGFQAGVVRPPTWSRVQTRDGKRTRESFVDESNGQFVRFSASGISDDALVRPPPGERILLTSSIGYESDIIRGGQRISKPLEFRKWARKLVGWWRRRATETLPVYECNYRVPATQAAYAAVRRGGLKVR